MRTTKDGARDLKDRLVCLTAANVEAARAIGEGNISLGIRRALDHAQSFIWPKLPKKLAVQKCEENSEMEKS